MVIPILKSLMGNYERNQSHTPKRLSLKLENSVSLAIPGIASQRTFKILVLCGFSTAFSSVQDNNENYIRINRSLFPSPV